MKNNKLIAEFMGYTHQSDSAFKDENGFWNDFEVFESWNWLMPVVEKVNKTPYKIVISSNVTELFDKEDNFIDF